MLKSLKKVCIEGRDIGTVILPKADIKFYFVCSLNIAAKRRFKELKKKDKNVKLFDVKKSLKIRNNRDKNRKNSPLIQSKDAVIVRTDKLKNIPGMMSKMSEIVDKKIKENMAVEAQTKNRSNSIKEFESLLNEDFKDRKLQENQIIKATVTEITKNFVVVDCKAKMEGMIPIEEFKNHKELEKIKPGSVIDVYLERIESFKGEIIISREKARRMAAWKKMEKVFETQEELVGYITGRVKGGYSVLLMDYRHLCQPAKLTLRPLKKIDHLMNVPVKVIATRIDRQRGNVCTSRRAVLEKSKNAEVKEALKNIKEGDIIENAKVKATTDWGIFLDINGLDALCHVSDISYGRVKKPSDLVTIGQQLKVRITKIDPITNRISASVKALTEDPYEAIGKKYKVGEIYEGGMYQTNAVWRLCSSTRRS